MIEIIGAYDQALFVWINSAGTPFWDPFWLVVTNKWSSIPLYVVLLFLLRQYYSWRQVIQTLVVMAVMILVTDQLANLFKYILVQRPRPCREEALQEGLRMVASYCGRYGYFSAHAASASALASFLIRWIRDYSGRPRISTEGFISKVMALSTLRFWIVLLLIWAVALGYSRIYVGVHYPYDVLTGWMVGLVLGGFVFYPLQRWMIRRFS